MRHCTSLDCEGLRRDGRPAEFQDEVEICADCGSTLVAGEAPALPPPGYRELEAIYVAPDPPTAHLIKGALESEGIPAVLLGEALAGAIGELPVTARQVTVQVPPEHAERAREIALQVEGP